LIRLFVKADKLCEASGVESSVNPLFRGNARGAD
jgi:hypothetical protein